MQYPMLPMMSPALLGSTAHRKDNVSMHGQPIQGIVSCDNATQRVGVLDCYCLTSNGDEEIPLWLVVACSTVPIRYTGKTMTCTIQCFRMCLNLMTRPVDT